MKKIILEFLRKNFSFFISLLIIKKKTFLIFALKFILIKLKSVRNEEKKFKM